MNGPNTEKSFSPPSNYQSYLVRLWRESPDEEWRLFIRSVTTGKEKTFANASELFEFLMMLVGDKGLRDQEKR